MRILEVILGLSTPSDLNPSPQKLVTSPAQVDIELDFYFWPPEPNFVPALGCRVSGLGFFVYGLVLRVKKKEQKKFWRPPPKKKTKAQCQLQGVGEGPTFGGGFKSDGYLYLSLRTLSPEYRVWSALTFLWGPKVVFRVNVTVSQLSHTSLSVTTCPCVAHDHRPI